MSRWHTIWDIVEKEMYVFFKYFHSEVSFAVIFPVLMIWTMEVGLGDAVVVCDVASGLEVRRLTGGSAVLLALAAAREARRAVSADAVAVRLSKDQTRWLPSNGTSNAARTRPGLNTTG